MKKILHLFLFVSLAAFTSGCVTPYMVDRGRDAADIFTATAGVGAGVKARVGPVHVGLLVNRDISGLRSGVFCPYWGNEKGIVALDFDYFIIPSCWGWAWDLFEPCHVPEERGKHIDACSGHVPFLYLSSTTGDRLMPHEYTQIDIVGGIGGTLRLGFNPGELLDFILGWTTIDIYNDDLEQRKRKEKIEQIGAR